MGYNITLVKLEGSVEIEQDWFDKYANGGFRDLVIENEWKYLNIDGLIYQRPVDFNKIKFWVENNICNKHYLLPALEQMQKDKDIWFYVSC